VRTIAQVVRGTATVLLAGMFVVAATGTTALAAEGKGTSKAHSSSGANGDCGEYCSTRDGSPSKNGNGGGKSTGRPCAGCVGKADDKNPPGQYPNGSDANNGYECDGNSGVGRSNPAHTGCTTPAAVEEPTTPDGDEPVVEQPEAPGTTVTEPVDQTGDDTAVDGTEGTGTTVPEVTEGATAPAGAPEVLGTGSVRAPEVLGTRFVRPGSRPDVAGGSLPFTGGSMTVELLLAAMTLVGAGAVVTRAGSKA
jgi:hypothetical protein